MANLDRSPRQWVLTGRMVFAGFVAFFAIVIGVNLIMARYAIKTFAGVETESSYKAGLAFESEAEQAAKQAGRHWDVEVELENPGGVTRTVLAEVKDAKGAPVSGLQAVGQFHHPVDARKDVALELQSVGNGRYRTTVTAPPGQWVLVIDFAQGDDRLFRSRNRVQLP